MGTTIHLNNVTCTDELSVELGQSNVMVYYSDTKAKLMKSGDIRTTSMYEYLTSGKKHMHVSKNVTDLVVIGDDLTNPLKMAITDISVDSNVSSIGAKSFLNCANLEKVDLPKTCIEINDEAFKGCEKLNLINCFTDNTFLIDNIGAHAFDGCNSLTSIHINLHGTNRETKIGSYAFANCKNLEKVSWERSSFLASNMFSGCDSLTSIQLPNYTSYAYLNAFADLKNLKSMTIPNKIWMLNDEMFKNDTSLTSVIISDGTTNDTKSVLDSIGASVFSGCTSLTSITLPKSITSFSQIDPNFLKGSRIKKVIFNGIPDSEFAITRRTVVDTGGYEYGKVYYYNNYNPSDSRINCTFQDTLNMITVAKTKNVPIFYMLGGVRCSNCHTTANTACSKDFKDKVKDKNILLLFTEWSSDGTKNGGNIGGTSGKVEQLWDDCGQSGSTLAFVHSYWKKKDGTTINTGKSTVCAGTANALYNCINSKILANTEKTKTTITLRNDVTTLGTPRSSIVFVSSSGTQYTFNLNNFEPYLAPVVDKTTTDNFKYGTWYYNAKELRAFADANNIPVFVEFGSKGCTPCQRFNKDIYKNKEFQDWVATQPYLFCHIEIEDSTESWNNPSQYPQPYYVDNVWAKSAQNYNSTSIPIMMWYWKRTNGTTLHEVLTYHYSPGGTPSIDADGLKDLIDTKFLSYIRDSAFDKVKIENIYTNSLKSNVCGQFYENLMNDTDGKYFATATKTSIESYDKLVIVNGTILDGIVVGQVVSEIPVGTYQFYEFSSSDTSNKNAKGIIFKITDNSNATLPAHTVEYIYWFTNETELEPSVFPYSVTTVHSNILNGKFTDMMILAGEYDIHTFIFKLRSDDAKSVAIHNIILSTEFLNYVKTAGCLIIEIYSTTSLASTTGPESELKTFINNPSNAIVVFNSYSTTDTPKLYDYMLCIKCTRTIPADGKYTPTIAQELDISNYTTLLLTSYIENSKAKADLPLNSNYSNYSNYSDYLDDDDDDGDGKC